MSRSLPPEVLQETFKYLSGNGEYRVKDLFSCALTNREWCNSVIPILWNQPFSYYKQSQLNSVIITFMASLDAPTKNQLKKNGIKEPSLMSTPAFDYPSFMRSLNYNGLRVSIRRWCFHTLANKPIKNDIPFYYNLLLRAFVKLLCERCNNLDTFLVETCMNPWYFSDSTTNLDGAHLFLCEPGIHSLIAPVKKMKFNANSNIHHYLNNTKNIQLSQSQAEKLAALMIVKNYLEYFQLVNCIRFTSVILNALQSQSHSIKELIFLNVNFFDCTTFKGWPSFKKLEKLKFLRCGGINEEFIENLVGASFPNIVEVTVNFQEKSQRLEGWASKINEKFLSRADE
ncbi:11844_t:CDS:1 [Acaulospora morrowiae]|uniref:11844_t:CDS:1 n=1 Tax=Acaulospora morrowiae TaxID=94023 RepID=A0A9N8YZN5_9GLOM|nr:11844_t:CDS:1 [Acaulospora morrowiae]